ncbi:MAG TPA: ABC transporter permease [Gemmatimonadaceae bacterium]|nr:ABC transporter permease [Gemmatimonadaceae bacterium]
MEKLLGDARVALRSLRRSPTFVATASAILAIGIGMAAAMYTVFTTVLVNRLPVVDQDRLVVMHPLDPRGTHLDAPFPYLAEIARDSQLFRGVAGVYHMGPQPVPFLYGSTTLNIAALRTSANLFDVLGMHAEHGRLFLPEDGRKGAPTVIVLSHAAWERYFGGDPAVLGRALVLPYTEEQARIVGVAPAGFAYPAGTEMWLPLPPDQTIQADIVARLAPNVTLDAARQGLFALTQRRNPFAVIPRAPGEAPIRFEVSGVEVHSLTDTVLGSSRPTLVALTVAVGLLLLIACVNVGNLMLVRFLGREREVAVRHAIGASHADVARLFLIESLVIAAIGGILGGVFAIGLLHIVSALAPTQLPRVDALELSSAPLGYTAGIVIFATMAFGFLPSILGARVRSYALLRADTRAGAEGRSKRRTRRWLVATQMALALVMLSGAALLVRTLTRLQSMDLGYRPEHLSILSFTGPESDLPNNDRIFAVAKQLVQRIEAVPGVVAATPIESNPFRGQSLFIMKLMREDEPASEREHAPFVPWEFVGPDYFRTFGITIRRGRGLLSADTKAAERVVVVNETLARQLWPGQDPIGKRVNELPFNNTYTVVGIASDTHFRELRKTGPVAYFNWDQVQPFWNGFVAVRTTAPLGAMMPALRMAIRDADAKLVLFDEKTMDELLDAPLAQPRLSALLLTGFSIVALLLSGIGLYGVMSSAVRQQTRDIGVRIALGATPGNVYQLILGEAAWVIGVGAVVGLVGAMLGGRVLAAQLFEVSPLDPVSLGGAAVLLLAIGVGAAMFPARRATRVDPAIALRSD